MKIKKLLLSCSLASAIFTSSYAYDLPGFNVGGTSFYDGAPGPAGSGWYFVEYLQYISADRLNDKDGNSLGLVKEDTDVFVPLSQLIYDTGIKWGNATPGVTVLLPWMAKSDVDDGANNAILSSQTGMGDVTLGAFLQFDPIMGSSGPVFSHRFEIDITVPTGDYDAKNAINPGANAWSVAPYYAATAWLTPKWTASARFIYLWNGKNDDPAKSLSATNNSQAGEAMNINFASAYSISKNISLGINGYYLKQLTDTQVDGQDVLGRKEKVRAIGPGMVYNFSKEDSVFANVYFEDGAQNRAEGNRFVLRINHHF